MTQQLNWSIRSYAPVKGILNLNYFGVTAKVQQVLPNARNMLLIVLVGQKSVKKIEIGPPNYGGHNNEAFYWQEKCKM